jgi:gamma-glutamylcysteine synthetase
MLRILIPFTRIGIHFTSFVLFQVFQIITVLADLRNINSKAIGLITFV